MKPKRFRWMMISLLFALAMGVLLWPASMPASGQATEWRVWMKVSPCSASRQEWVSVADRDPTTGAGGNHYIQFPASHIWTTFAAAIAEANTLRVAPCTFFTGETGTCPKYANYCCANYRVFRNSGTGQFTVVAGLYGNPGGGFTEQQGGPMCCEDAAQAAGYPASFCGGSDSPVRVSAENNVDRHGQDYRNFDLPRPSPDLCSDACAHDPNCKAYTYVKAGVQGPNARCWLKSGVPPGTPSTCCVSGVKSVSTGGFQRGGTDRGAGGSGGNRGGADGSSGGRTNNPGERPCNANEAAAFSKMTGSFKSYRMHITIGGSCEQATGTFKYTEWCEGVDETGNSSLKRVTGNFKGRIAGGSLEVTWDAPASPSSGARKGTGSCSPNSNGTFSCSGFPCGGQFKTQ
jgi:hypothetical protein